MKSLNQVRIRGHLTQNARICQAADRMFNECRAINAALYLVTLIPALLVFLVPSRYQFICSAVSLFLNVVTQVTETAMSNHKERAIMVLQLYEANITNTIYARIEYDRESTNEAYEYSIKKSRLKDTKKYLNYYVVPDNVEEKYSYLFTQRKVVADDRYLLGKWRICLAILMFGIAAIAVSLIIALSFKYEYTVNNIIPQIVCFWPVIIPLVTNFNEAGASSKRCVKISADIDNFFADHDRSSIRLERFNYYIQSLMFEFRLKLKPIPHAFSFCFKPKMKVMEIGICERFLQAIYDLEGNTSLGKMKNAAFIEAEIRAVDAAGNEYIPTKSKEEDSKDIPDQINIMIRKNTEAIRRARAIEKLNQNKEVAKKKANSTSSTKSSATSTSVGQTKKEPIISSKSVTKKEQVKSSVSSTNKTNNKTIKPSKTATKEIKPIQKNSNAKSTQTVAVKKTTKPKTTTK